MSRVASAWIMAFASGIADVETIHQSIQSRGLLPPLEQLETLFRITGSASLDSVRLSHERLGVE